MTEKTGKCYCKQRCSKRYCSCFKFGVGCNSSCKCESSCRNIFNYLEYFFGDNKKCSANSCFSKWLIKKVENLDELKMIDRNELRRRIMQCPSYTNNFLDKKLNRWTQKWITIDEDKKIKHIQKFFRILLSDNKTTFYYSFCHNDLVERDWKWHCIKCNKCTYGVSLTCTGCGEKK